MTLLFYFLMITSASSIIAAVYYSIKDMYKNKTKPKKCDCALSDDYISFTTELLCDCDK